MLVDGYIIETLKIQTKELKEKSMTIKEKTSIMTTLKSEHARS
jgi:hypothetical protein